MTDFNSLVTEKMKEVVALRKEIETSLINFSVSNNNDNIYFDLDLIDVQTDDFKLIGLINNSFIGENNDLNTSFYVSFDRVSLKDIAKIADYCYNDYDFFIKNMDNLPKEVTNLFNDYNDKKNGDVDSELQGYDLTAKLLEDVKLLGYEFDYGLDNDPINLRKIRRFK